ncbi:MAG: cupin [Candidatus Aegiribacteria sp. MLS_C]|nr:MAG: cupin [Candidatus Aegiribacteria sp. MLS_C]
MSGKIEQPSVIQAHGSKPKLIEEYVGRVNSGTEGVSITRMRSPEGWAEPGQRPGFDEYTLVLEGTLSVSTEDGDYDIHPGEVFIADRGSWVRYSTPYPGGADYIAVCLPAFSPEHVHRDGVNGT